MSKDLLHRIPCSWISAITILVSISQLYPESLVTMCSLPTRINRQLTQRSNIYHCCKSPYWISLILDWFESIMLELQRNPDLCDWSHWQDLPLINLLLLKYDNCLRMTFPFCSNKDNCLRMTFLTCLSCVIMSEKQQEYSSAVLLCPEKIIGMLIIF